MFFWETCLLVQHFLPFGSFPRGESLHIAMPSDLGVSVSLCQAHALCPPTSSAVALICSHIKKGDSSVTQAEHLNTGFFCRFIVFIKMF